MTRRQWHQLTVQELATKLQELIANGKGAYLVDVLACGEENYQSVCGTVEVDDENQGVILQP